MAEALENIAPKVATYDSYAGELVREYGLLVPVEPTARIITEAERYSLAYDVVRNYTGQLEDDRALATIIDILAEFQQGLGNRG